MPSLQAGVAAATLDSFHSPHSHFKGSMDPQMTSGSGVATPSSSSVASTSTSNTNLPVRASCDECRRRKLKCDGNRETCDRCKASGVQCHYNVRARIGRPKGTTKAARAASVSTANGASPPGAAPSPPAAKKPRYTPPEVTNALPTSISSASSYLATIPVAPPAVDDPFKMLNVPGPSSSSAYASNPFGVAPGSSNEPSALDSLELAAYLESLDRVKISSSDGLTAGMLQGGDSFGPPPPPPPVPSYLMGSSAGTTNGFDSSLLLDDVNGSTSNLQSHPQSTGSSSSSSWWAGTILDEAVSYAVPSDLSWCHWNLDEGLMGTAPTASSPASQQQQNGTTAASHHAGTGLAAGPGQPAAEWPRGAQEGMGNGHIETQEGGIVQGGPWPSAVAPPQPSTPVAAKKSCCSSTAKAETPQPVQEASPRKKGPCPRTGVASCCCSTTDPMSSPAKSGTPKLDHERERPATSPGASASSLSPRVHCVPNPSGTGCTCLCQSDVCLLRVKRTLSPSAADDGDTKGSRGGVGAGGSDEPLSLHLTLSASQAISASCACSSTCPTCAKPPSRADGEENSGGEEGVEGESAAAAAHRAKRYNASLLISLALQIYTRAVRILRDGFGISTGAGTSNSASTSTGTPLLGSVGTTSRPASSSSSSTLLPTSTSSSQSTVQIGSSYVPRPANAQRIALLAIRLELLDLEEGMARIWQMGGGGASANGASNGSSSGSSNGTGSGSGTSTALLAPIDGLVISKLRGQLREMVGRVEGLERDWDKRRGAEGRAMP